MTDRKMIVNRLIETSNFIDYLKTSPLFSNSMIGVMTNAIDDAVKLIKEQEWISVEEQLPKSMANEVLVYLQHEELVDQIGYGHYEKFNGEEMWYDLEHDEQFSKRGYTVTHWMPLPKSPKGERLTLN